MALERPQDGVLGAGQLGGDRVVERRAAYAPSFSRTACADPLAVGAAADLRHQRPSSPRPCPWARWRRSRRPRRRRARASSSSESCCGQVALDQLRLGLLGVRLLGRGRPRGRPRRPRAGACARAAARRPRRPCPPSRPAGGRRRACAAADALALAGLHRRLHVRLDLLEDAHRLKRSRRASAAPLRLAGRPARAAPGVSDASGPGPGLAHDLGRRRRGRRGAAPGRAAPRRRAARCRAGSRGPGRSAAPGSRARAKRAARRGREMRWSRASRETRTMQSGMKPASARASSRRPAAIRAATRDEVEPATMSSSPRARTGPVRRMAAIVDLERFARPKVPRLTAGRPARPRPSGICRKRVPSSRKVSASPVQRKR